MRKIHFFVLLFIAIALAGCAGGAPTPIPTQAMNAPETAAIKPTQTEIPSTSTPTITPTPAPSSTPAPTGTATVTGPQYGELPVTPTLDYWSAKGKPVARQNAVACQDLASVQQLKRVIWSGDLTNDGQDDYIVDHYKGGGDEIFILSCHTGNLQVIKQVGGDKFAYHTQLRGVMDLNRNNVPEVVVGLYSFLAWEDGKPHISDGEFMETLLVLEWNGTEFSRYIIYVPGVDDNWGYGNVELKDVDNNGNVEIVIYANFYISTDQKNTYYWDVYPLRESVQTYAWDGNGYSLMKNEKVPAAYSFQLMADAAETTDYKTLKTIYETIITDEYLRGWSADMDAYKVAMAKYYKGGQQGTKPTFPASNEQVLNTDRAWAYYYMITRAAAEGDLEQAKIYNTKFQQSRLATLDVAKPMLELTAAFWNEYSISRDISQACYKARLAAVQQGMGEASSRCDYQEKQPLTLAPLPAERTVNQAPVTELKSQAELNALPGIWDVTKITNLDLAAPGVRSFDQTLPKNEPLAWPFYWCTKNNPEIFKNNLDNMTVYFFINGQRVPDEYVTQYHTESQHQQCNSWATSLKDWASGSKVQLEIVYFFRTAIFDGTSKYPAGEYRYRLTVHLP